MTIDASEPVTTKRRVLVVDDNKDILQSLVFLLDGLPHQVNYTDSAIVAIDLAHRFKPDVVLLDLLLPDVHGAEVCRLLRKNPHLSSTRIYGITASSNPDDRHRAIDAGCNDVLVKPIEPATYQDLIIGPSAQN